MNVWTLVWAVGIAFVYASWSIVGRWTGASAGIISVAVCGGTFLSTAAIMTKQFSTEHAPRFTSVVLLLAIGIVNGCAVYMQSLKATDPTVSAGVLMMTICIMMVVWAAILDFALNGASLSGRQGAGLALAILAIYLLKK